MTIPFDRVISELWDALGYPPVPPPTLDPHKDGVGLPGTQGIYFFWDGDEVVYVGKSSNLSKRVRLRQHHVLNPSYRISYIAIDHPRELIYAESFYIGVLRPRRNFANYRSHHEERRAWKQIEAVS